MSTPSILPGPAVARAATPSAVQGAGAGVPGGAAEAFAALVAGLLPGGSGAPREGHTAEPGPADPTAHDTATDQSVAPGPGPGLPPVATPSGTVPAQPALPQTSSPQTAPRPDATVPPAPAAGVPAAVPTTATHPATATGAPGPATLEPAMSRPGISVSAAAAPPAHLTPRREGAPHSQAAPQAEFSRRATDVVPAPVPAAVATTPAPVPTAGSVPVQTAAPAPAVPVSPADAPVVSIVSVAPAAEPTAPTTTAPAPAPESPVADDAAPSPGREAIDRATGQQALSPHARGRFEASARPEVTSAAATATVAPTPGRAAPPGSAAAIAPGRVAHGEGTTPGTAPGAPGIGPERSAAVRSERAHPAAPTVDRQTPPPFSTPFTVPAERAVAPERSSAAPDPAPPVAGPAPSATAPTNAPTAPTPTAAPAAPHPAATAAQFVAPVVAVHRRGVDGSHVLTVELTPDRLGPVRLEIELREGLVGLRLAGGTDVARDALNAALPELRRVLEAAGVPTGSLQVSADLADSGPSDLFATSRETGSDAGSGRSPGESHRAGRAGPDRDAPPGPERAAAPAPDGRPGLDLQL